MQNNNNNNKDPEECLFKNKTSEKNTHRRTHSNKNNRNFGHILDHHGNTTECATCVLAVRNHLIQV